MPATAPDAPQPEGLTVTDAVSQIQGLLPTDEVVPETPESSVAEEPEEPVSEEPEATAEVEDTEPEGEPEPPPVYTVKVDGQDVEVTLEEALKGYSRTADYTRKTQTLATERKTLDAERATIRDARDQYAARLKVLDESLGDPQEPDWDTLRSEHPENYPLAVADWQRHRAERQALHAERDRVAQEQLADRRHQLTEKRSEEHALLVEAIPAFKDPEQAVALTGKMVKAATQYGYSADEVGQVIDHRALRLLHDAMLYRDLQAKGRQVTTKAKASPTAKPGAAQPAVKKGQKDAAAAMDRLTKTGSVHDAATLLQHLGTD